MLNPLVVSLDGYLSQRILSHFLHIESKTVLQLQGVCSQICD